MQDDVAEDNYYRNLNPGEYAYLELLDSIMRRGGKRMDRTGTGTMSLFGSQLRFDLRDGTFPLLTTKKVWLKGVALELLWMLKGETNVAPLQAQGVHIWDQWADADGDLGPVYGAQWRNWGQSSATNYVGQLVNEGRDQLQELVDGLKRDPFGRRHIVTAWNPDEISKQKLPPCHCFFQCLVTVDMELVLILHQRSADMFLGVPFNIASYSLLTCMLAQVTGLKPGMFIHNFGDAHIYLSHLDAVRTQLSRTPRRAPTLKLDSSIDNLFKFEYDHIKIEGYDPHDKISAPVAV